CLPGTMREDEPLPAYPHLVVAVAAIDGLVIAREEWDLTLRAAFRADDLVHFARPRVAATCSRHRLTPSRAALRAAARLVHQALLLVKLLLARREDEVLAAIAALQRLVLKHAPGPPRTPVRCSW